MGSVGMSIKKYFNSIGEKLSLFKGKSNDKKENSSPSVTNPERQQKPKQKAQAVEPVLLEQSLKNISSTTYKNEIKLMLEKRLKQNLKHYNKAVTSYFANLILFNAVQTKDGKTFVPQDLAYHDSLEDMFSLVALVDTHNESEDKVQEFGLSDKLTLEGVLRWFSDSYVRVQFEYMLLEEVRGVALIDHALLEEDVRVKQLRGVAISKLEEELGEVFFISLRATLLNTLRDKSPIDLFRAGELGAKAMTHSHSKHMEDMAEENKELLESISRVNGLWLSIVTNYEMLYHEKFPKGRLTEELYDSKLVTVLHNLKKEGISEEDIHELSILDNKMDLAVRRKIASFGFVRGF